MNRGKPIHISQTSLLGLKAELYKKREEIKFCNTKTINAEYVKGPLSKNVLKAASDLRTSIALKAKQRKEISKGGEDDTDYLADELKRSNEMLQKKAELYEKLSKEGLDIENEDESYLVNFNKKVIETFSKQSDEEDEWLEYTDSFGRTRKCRKDELPNIIKMDKDIKEYATSRETKLKPEELSFDTKKDNELHLDSNRDQEPSVNPEEPIHFQNVQHSEIRDLGVGYFAFSQEEEERTSQMKMLNKLREQTLTQRKRTQDIKAKKKATLKARLEKVMAKKNIKRDISEIVSSDEDEIPEKISKDEEQEKEKLPIEAPRIPPKVRPWDRGKVSEVKHFSQNKWLENQREERNPDFAPPSFYFN